MKVYSVSQKKLIDVPDTETTTPVSQTQSATLETPQTITGHTLQEHAQALNQAKAVGDTDAIKSIQDDYDREYQYQKDYGKVKLTGTAVTDMNFVKGIISSAQDAAKRFNPKYTGLGNAITGSLGIALNAPDAAEQVALRQSIQDVRSSIRKYVSGVAVTPQEGKELTKLIPKITDSDIEVKTKITHIQELMMRKAENVLSTAGYNKSAEEYLGTGVIVPEAEIGPFQLPIIGPMINQLKGFAQDVGSGAAVKSKDYQAAQKANEDAQIAVRKVVQRAKVETDPIKKQKLLDFAQEQSAKLGDIGMGSQPQFSEDINKPYLQRALETGANIAFLSDMVASLPKILKGGINTIRGISNKQLPDIGNAAVSTVEKAKSYTPKAIFEAKQAESAAETVGKVVPDVQKIIEVGTKLAETDPDIEAEAIKNAPKILNIKDVPTLLERMQVWGRQAFTKGGTIKSAAKATLYSGYYQEALNILRDAAPEVYENRQLLRYSYELPKIAGKWLWKATLGKVLTSGI